MIAQVEQSAERDAAIEAVLPHVPYSGWTTRALRDSGVPDADLLFPAGARDLIEAWCDLADRRMSQAALAEPGFSELGMTARVRRLIALRLEQARPHREAVRRAIGLLALPANRALAARCTARTLDAIWHAAGDRSADMSWYSKRALLAGVYATTLLAWLRDTTENDAATLAFLDRRLAGIGRLGRMMGRIRRGPPRPEAAPAAAPVAGPEL